MEDRAVFTNKEKALAVYKWTIKKYIPFSIAYWILLFITLPMIEIFGMIVCFSEDHFKDYTKGLDIVAGNITASVFAFVAILFATIIAIMAFSYMHNKRKVDLFGSFPMSRRTLFFARYFAVLTLAVVPVIVFGTLGALLTLNDTAMIEVIKNIGIIIVSLIGNISFIAFISVCCGTVADVIISYGIINIVYPICVFICYFFPERTVPGMEQGYLPATIFTFFCPFASSYTAAFGTGKEIGIIWWLVFSVILMSGCYALCKKRKAEMAQNAFAFVAVEIVIKFVSCFTVGFGSGWVLSYLGEESVGAQYIWFAVGFIIGAMVTNVLLHLVFHRGLSKYNSSLGLCGIVTVAGMGFLFVVTSGAFGYDTRVPDESEIKEVSINVGNDSFKIDGKNVLERYTDNKNAIQSVVKIHQKMIAYAKKNKHVGLYAMEPSYDYYEYSASEDYDDYDNASDVKIIYKLKDGKTMRRYYSDAFCCNSGVAKEILMLSKQKCFSDEDYMMTAIPEKYVSGITIGVRDDDVYGVYDDDADVEADECTYSFWLDKNYHKEYKKEKVSKLLSALKKDIQKNGLYKEKESDIGKFRGYEICIEYESVQDDRYDAVETIQTGMIQIPETYVNTLKALEETGYGNVTYYSMTTDDKAFDHEDMLSEYKDSDRSIYFTVPKSWNQNLEIRCMPYAKGRGCALADLDHDIAKCEKVSEDVWKYTLPEMEDVKITKIMFYQYSNTQFNFSGFIDLETDVDNNMLSLGEKEPKKWYDDYVTPLYKYSWSKYEMK